MKNRLRQIRVQRGLTQQELAQAVGTSRQTIYSIEKGRSIPSASLLLKVARFFDLDVEQIFWLDEERKEDRR